MAAGSVFDDLKKALNDFKAFLATNVPIIKPVFQKLTQFVPQLKDLVDKLIDLMGKLKTAVQNLNVPGLDKLPGLADTTKAVLNAAKSALPDQAGPIGEVLTVAEAVRSVPSLDALKKEISDLIDAIVTDLKSLES